MKSVNLEPNIPVFVKNLRISFTKKPIFVFLSKHAETSLRRRGLQADLFQPLMTHAQVHLGCRATLGFLPIIPFGVCGLWRRCVKNVSAKKTTRTNFSFFWTVFVFRLLHTDQFDVCKRFNDPDKIKVDKLETCLSCEEMLHISDLKLPPWRF